jgi:CDP-6-deoxy-D-xylo-4-hexulose-3-dehydrase
MPSAAELKSEILALARQYQADSGGLAALVESLLAMDAGGANHVERFEDRLTRLFGTREALLVSSGTSANHVAISSLTSPRMGKLRLRPGDKVITAATGSPSLVKAILQNKLVPVFADIVTPSFNVDVRRLQSALSSRTRAIALAHAFGNPFDLDTVTLFAAFNNLLLIEDCRDAAGAGFAGRPVGCFGQFATVSFHAGRQIPAGAGGAVLMTSPVHRSIAESCAGSFRAPEMLGAVGSIQIELLAPLVDERNRNASSLLAGIAGLSEYFILPETVRGARPSWLELPIVVRQGAPFERNRLLEALGAAGIAVRPFPQPFTQQTAHLPVTRFAASHGFLLRVPPAAGQQRVPAILDALHRAVTELR